jgi:hypothetical protein
MKNTLEEKVKNWGSVQEYFQTLNLNFNVEYLILRNFEELLDAKINMEHADIDILCSNPKLLVSASDAFPRVKNDDGIHYFVKINNIDIELDVRWIGDGYYDTNWEKEMLRTKELYRNSFYIMNQENYFYSLLYHALVHKHCVADDYKSRLLNMSKELNIVTEVDNFNIVLNRFMKLQEYRYTYPINHKGILNFKKIDKSLVEINPYKRTKRCFYAFIKLVHKLKGKILINNGRKN